MLVLVGGSIGAWYTLRNDSKWHSEWIKKHTEESDAREQKTTEILSALLTTNAHLTTLTEGHGQRIDRIEHSIDRTP